MDLNKKVRKILSTTNCLEISNWLGNIAEVLFQFSYQSEVNSRCNLSNCWSKNFMMT